ncbi:glycosyltransferase family 2 protein [Clostridium perfringens]
MQLSIIIVTYNSEKVIKGCIESIINCTKNINYEIIIVDNSSVDKTLDIIKMIKSDKIKIVKSPNKGFNYGNNRGIEIARGKYICLLNPDTILLNNAFDILIKEMEKDNRIGACGGQLLDENLNRNLTFGVFPSLKSTILMVLGVVKMSKFKGKKKKKYKVDFPVGANFLFRKSIINKIGYLDENYFLYFDETDFAYRIKKEGYNSYIFSNARIIHLEGKSTEELSEFAQEKFLESYIYYNRKFLSKYETKSISNIYIFYNIIISYIKKYIKVGDYKYNLNQVAFHRSVLDRIKEKG